MPSSPHTAIRHLMQTTQGIVVRPDGLETSGFKVPANHAVFLTGNLKNILSPNFGGTTDPIYQIQIINLPD